MKTIQTEELLHVVYGRRAIRKYADAPVEAEVIEQLIEAAIQAPSALDAQPWGFAVIGGVGRLRGLSDRVKAHLRAGPQLDPRLARLLSHEQDVFHDAPALVIVCATSAGTQAAEDCCLAGQNFMLAAFAYGLGTCPIGLARDWLNLPDVKRELGIPDDWSPVLPIALGVPAERPEGPGRHAAPVLWL